MALNDKSYLINRKNDWLNNGIVENFYFSDDEMILQTNTGKNGYFMSFAFDSYENEAVWHRMRIKSCIPENALMRVSVYASDSLKADIYVNAAEKKEIVIDDYIRDENIPISERMHLLNKFSSTVRFDNCYDVPLFAAKGRYLWVAIEAVNYNNSKLSIESMRLDFPMDSFAEFLPEIYRKNSEPNSFFNRFLGVYQAIHDDINDQLNNLPELLDPKKVNKEFLEWLVDWFSIKDSDIWSEDKLRELLFHIVDFYKIKGTKKAIKEIARFYVGSDVKIVEQYDITQNEYYKANKPCLQNLFGENAYTFTVIVEGNKIKSTDEYIAMYKLMNMFKPAETKCNLVVLNDSIYLDYHCYLGINSYLSQNKEMVLSGDAVIMDSIFLSE